MAKKLTQDDWAKDCAIKHNGKYSYSKAIYKTAHEKVCIICPIHGEFWQGAFTHKKGVGCPKCASEKDLIRKKLQAQDFSKIFASRANEIHNGKYDYSKVKYKTARVKVCIICPVHGEFWQPPDNHLAGHGCPKCRNDFNKINNSSNIDKFSKIASEKYNNKYNYRDSIYISATDKIIINCPEHGDFISTPNMHLNGIGCPLCKKSERAAKIAITGRDNLIKQGSIIHKDKYDYSKVVYINYDTPVEIICPKHGSFWQTPDKHIQGCGCQRCALKASYREEDLCDFLKEYFELKPRDRKILKGKEIDILIPSKGIGVEYNGSMWHSELYSSNAKWAARNKQLMCDELGIRLIHVFDYERQDVIKKTLKAILGIETNKTYARKCEPSIETYSKEHKDFINNHHLQGEVKGCYTVCLRKDGELKAIGCFSKVSSERGAVSDTRYELRRYCSDGVVVGGLSRIIKTFTREFSKCKEIITYSDNKWFTGESYSKIGFKHVKDVPPDYKYVCSKKNFTIRHKGRMRRSYLAKLPDIEFDPNKTEVENCNDNGWYRVWDCGKKKWLLEV